MWRKVLVFIQNQTTQLQQSTYAYVEMKTKQLSCNKVLMHMLKWKPHNSATTKYYAYVSWQHWAAVVLSVCNVPASSEEDLPCGSAPTLYSQK